MKANGYQLLECLIVCLLLTATIGIGSASLSRFVNRYRLEVAAKAMASQLGSIRAAAVSERVPLSVSISECRSKYGMGPRNSQVSFWRVLPEGVKIVHQPGQCLTFYSRGSVVPAGSYQLANRAGRCKVVVSPTGRIRCENIF